MPGVSLKSGADKGCSLQLPSCPCHQPLPWTHPDFGSESPTFGADRPLTQNLIHTQGAAYPSYVVCPDQPFLPTHGLIGPGPKPWTSPLPNPHPPHIVVRAAACLPGNEPLLTLATQNFIQRKGPALACALSVPTCPHQTYLLRHTGLRACCQLQTGRTCAGLSGIPGISLPLPPVCGPAGHLPRLWDRTIAFESHLRPKACWTTDQAQRAPTQAWHHQSASSLRATSRHWNRWTSRVATLYSTHLPRRTT